MLPRAHEPLQPTAPALCPTPWCSPCVLTQAYGVPWSPLLSETPTAAQTPTVASVSAPTSRLHLGRLLPVATHTAPGQTQPHCDPRVCFPNLGSQSRTANCPPSRNFPPFSIQLFS